ncbi:MAG TPA: energy transducer TonB [Pseudobdellovibrionaceae bacterium]|nr:energy transducer TonB [Pseudobdellovibrionaceae bacterium]
MRKFSFRNAIILSLGLHVAVAAYLTVAEMKTNRPHTDAVTIEILETPKAVADKPVSPKTKQIVEQDAKSLNDETPSKEAYLSAADQRVEKETVARERGEFRNMKNSARHSTQAGGKPQERLQAQPRPSLRDLMGNDPVASLQRKQEWQRQNVEGEQAQDGAEASRSSDHLKDVAEGGETMLNTREFKYYTYYSRIRRQLAQYWEPKVKTKLHNMFRQGRRIASDKDHVTKLLIILNEQGLLVGVQVVNESGVVDLDDAATEAFRAAAPFPNPPEGIIESDGTVKIRWDFVLES